MVYRINGKRNRLEVLLSSLFFFACILHYFSRRPLWLDEISLFDNIKNLNYSELFGPLRHAQAFPRVYLAVIKAVAGIFDYHVLALRFFSLVSMLAAYIVWREVFKNIFGRSWGYLLAVAAMTGSYYFSYYSAEFKAYATDVLVAGIFCLFWMRTQRWETGEISRKDYVLSGLLAFSVFISYMAAFFVPALGWRMGVLALRQKTLRPLCVFYSFWAVTVLVVLYFVDVRFAVGDKSLMAYWDSYCLCTTSAGCFGGTFWEGLRRLSTVWYGKEKIFIRTASFLIPIFIYSLVRHGFMAWVKEKFSLRSLETLGTFIFVELFILGLLHKFPFTGERITLFFAPFVIIFIIRGILDLTQGFRPLGYAVAMGWSALLLCAYINTVSIFLRLY